MNIALTHEQADFDAIASLMGAHLLEKPLPLVPARMNLNVRSFVTKYRSELPLMELKDLPSRAIQSITLVDTQSLVTLKGMSQQTKITVHDHHTRRSNLSPLWDVSLYDLGACTTVFVERIQNEGLPLTVLQATLLLLGIYEDTGSLTYTRTTARDVRAAAFLLECGASLQIAGEYLYPPLSSDQRKLYDELLSNTKVLHIHGLEVVLATAFAEEMTDEVSSAAHKMRDLLEPDGLFLLISTRAGIRLVARSTTDQIDVSAVTAHFGGGGHQRAAAALIRIEDKTPDNDRPAFLQRIYEELTALLPSFVQPSITVGEIMSKRPSLLSPAQNASDASNLMRRYGYEGFPVVEGGRVVGLLTRRAVDRALAHKLDLRVGSLMDAGEVTIQPSQTLDELHLLMNTTGWGQIPVVDPQDGRVIGIVTRTDLIRTLSNGQKLPSRQNLAAKLEKALPPARLSLLKRIASEAAAQNQALYIVGGFVRDLLLDRPSLDLDLVVEGNAIALAQTLAARYGGKVVSHRRFVTAKWQICDEVDGLAAGLTEDTRIDPAGLPETVDLISARTEFYDHPTALPVVERSSIRLDLHRRDFSINTLALRLDGNYYGDLYDYWGGVNDLGNRLIRVLHSLSFVDDPTRLLRAVRFEQRFNFTIEVRTLQLMQEAHELMRQVSGDRIRHELDLILNEPKVIAMLERLQELGMLDAISPYLIWSHTTSAVVSQVNAGKPEDFWQLPDKIGNINLKQALIYLAWLSSIPLEHASAVSKRLKFNSLLHRSIVQNHRAGESLRTMKDGKPSDYVKILKDLESISLYTLYRVNDEQHLRHIIQNYIQKWQDIKPFADGDTLRQYQITPGPIYRLILERLRDAWLDGHIDTRQEEDRLLERLIDELQ